LHQVVDQQNAVASETVTCVGGERSDDRRRHEHDQRHDPCLPSSTAFERVDEDRDPRRELGHVEPEERELDATQVRVGHDRAEDPRPLAHRRSMAAGRIRVESRFGGPRHVRRDMAC
jgi:hypothetical protein